jgi:hypothetical protein
MELVIMINAAKTAEQTQIGISPSLSLETDIIRRMIEKNRSRITEATEGYYRVYQRVKTNDAARNRLTLWEQHTQEVLTRSVITFEEQYKALNLGDFNMSKLHPSSYKTQIRITHPFFKHLISAFEELDKVFICITLNWINQEITEKMMTQAEQQAKNLIEKFLGRVLYLVTQSESKRYGGIFSDKGVAAMLGLQNDKKPEVGTTTSSKDETKIVDVVTE